MLIHRRGNLFDNYHQAYAHGVNSLGKMDSGIAIQFKKRYMDMYLQYKDLCKRKILTSGDVFFYKPENCNDPSIFNLVTQKDLGFADPLALFSSLEKMFILAKSNDITDIAIPKIGTGHGKLREEALLHAIHPFISSSSIHITLYGN